MYNLQIRALLLYFLYSIFGLLKQHKMALSEQEILRREALTQLRN
jgi:hypothetical protein